LDKETTLRRVPQQDRGERRVKQILEAAAQLFAKIGYEAATTNAIAACANTSIGSLYQFFPNKEAILHALANRYLEQLRALYDNVLTSDKATLALPELVDHILNPLAEFKATHPGFEAIFSGTHASPTLAEAAAELHQVVITRIEAIFAVRAPTVDSGQRRLYATISVAVVEALFLLAETAKPEVRPQLIAEMKRLLVVYLGPVIGVEGK
jgi:AcrR family transcriptional regulator